MQENVLKTYTAIKGSTPERSAVHKEEEEEGKEMKRKEGNMELPLCLTPECRDNWKGHYINYCAVADKKT